MLSRTYKLLRETVDECVKDNTPMLAAGLSFYTLLSMAPALWVLVGITGAIVGRASARGQIMDWTNTAIGQRAAQYVGGVVDKVDTSSSLATVIGLVSMFFGATLVFGALHDSLNLIWEVPPVEGRHWIRGFFVKRLVGFLVVLLMGVLILATLLVHAAITVAARFVPDFLPAPSFVLQIVTFLIAMVTILLLFAGIYRFLHDATMNWHDVWVGAAVTSVLFAIGKMLIGIYLASAGLSSAYGAAGSLVVLLLWVYYSAQIFLFGAEFTEVYARSRRS